MPKGVYIRTDKNRKIGSNNPNYKGGNSPCFYCKKVLNYRYSWRKQPKCRECYLKNCTGKNSSNWKGGKEYPNCLNCNIKTKDWNSILCRNCYRGALHHSWKGGISRIQSLIRASKENRQWIKQCLYRDNWTCQECGFSSKDRRKDKYLQVHHIKSFSLILKENKIDSLDGAKECEELWNIDNGKTLCINCHKLTKNYSTKLK